MSLKIFHLIFITLAFLLCAFCAGWAFVNQAHPAFAYSCVALAIALVIYGIFFVRKSRRIIV